MFPSRHDFALLRDQAVARAEAGDLQSATGLFRRALRCPSALPLPAAQPNCGHPGGEGRTGTGRAPSETTTPPRPSCRSCGQGTGSTGPTPALAVVEADYSVAVAPSPIAPCRQSDAATPVGAQGAAAAAAVAVAAMAPEPVPVASQVDPEAGSAPGMPPEITAAAEAAAAVAGAGPAAAPSIADLAAAHEMLAQCLMEILWAAETETEAEAEAEGRKRVGNSRPTGRSPQSAAVAPAGLGPPGQVAQQGLGRGSQPSREQREDVEAGDVEDGDGEEEEEKKDAAVLQLLQEALHHAAEACSLRPQWPVARLTFARCLRNSGLLDEALRELHGAAQLLSDTRADVEAGAEVEAGEVAAELAEVSELWRQQLARDVGLPGLQLCQDAGLVGSGPGRRIWGCGVLLAGFLVRLAGGGERQGTEPPAVAVVRGAPARGACGAHTGGCSPPAAQPAAACPAVGAGHQSGVRGGAAAGCSAAGGALDGPARIGDVAAAGDTAADAAGRNGVGAVDGSDSSLGHVSSGRGSGAEALRQWAGSSGIPCSKGTRVLELGCGSGLVSIAMAACGAHCVMTDLPEVLPAAAAAAEANAALVRSGGGSLASWPLDWADCAGCCAGKEVKRSSSGTSTQTIGDEQGSTAAGTAAAAAAVSWLLEGRRPGGGGLGHGRSISCQSAESTEGQGATREEELRPSLVVGADLVYSEGQVDALVGLLKQLRSMAQQAGRDPDPVGPDRLRGDPFAVTADPWVCGSERKSRSDPHSARPGCVLLLAHKHRREVVSEKLAAALAEAGIAVRSMPWGMGADPQEGVDKCKQHESIKLLAGVLW